MRLGPDGFARARAYLFEQGRPLEQALFRYFFEGADAASVAEALAYYQNGDGGFGHAIEADFHLPASSPLQTSVALQLVVDVSAAATDELAVAAVDYLDRIFDSRLEGWRAAPLQVNDYPHAPWWRQDTNDPPDLLAMRHNPGLELAGYLVRWGRPAYADWALDVIRQTSQLEVHAMLCCLRLLATPGLPDSVREAGLELVERSWRGIETEPSRWGSYGVKPLSAAPTPDAILAERLRDLIGLQLDYEIERQGADGAWVPHWSWGDAFPDVWARARRDWASAITLEMLRALQAWDRL